MATEGDLVQLWIYDLSGGLARMYSQMLLGRQASLRASGSLPGFEWMSWRCMLQDEL